jgi:formamidopyrimidine-DNA glycosylase
VVVYVERLQSRVGGKTLERVRLGTPFVLRSVDPPLADVEGKRVLSVARMGKRIVLGLEQDLFLVLHLMIAGRLRWREAGAPLPRKFGLAAFDFPVGTLLFTEAGSKRRASMFVVRGSEAVEAQNPGGLEVLEVDLCSFRAALTRERHTVKRALTDPRLFSGIGNVYSDEILHRAKLSPLRLTQQLSEEEIERLYEQAKVTLTEWTERLRQEAGANFPETVRAIRDGRAVHGRFGQPCPTCGAPIQRIVYAENEANYCARCQTGGKVLADRALSRLLREDWPRTIDEWSERPGTIGRKR